MENTMTNQPRPELPTVRPVVIAVDELAQFLQSPPSDRLLELLATCRMRRPVLDELSARAFRQYATVEEFVAGHGI
jgi:hypothetical protein